MPKLDTERAAHLVARLSTKERIRLLSGATMWSTETVGDVPSVSLSNGPNGLGKQASDADHVGGGDLIPATCFPSASVLASTWDEPLLERVGAALGREARAEGVGVLLGPGLNIKRHPGGGRVFEYFSEDPVVSGRVAAALVRGVQSEGVGTSVKHFAGNNQETDRMRLDSVIDERTLREIYLRGFEIVVRESAPWTVMTSYNRLNGEHTGESEWLITRILREEWGFEGLVMSDWMAVHDRVQGLRAGLDLEMPGGPGVWDDRIAAAVDDGSLAADSIEASAQRVASLALRARAEAESRPRTYDREAHHALARETAAAGTVLLTNDGMLPLHPRASLAVIGAAAEHPRFQGVGSAAVNPWRVDTLLDALRDRANTTYSPAYDPRTSEVSDTGLAEARDAAAAADQVVLVLGVPGGAEAEGVDRSEVTMPESFTILVREIVRANPRTAVVLANGAPLEITWADEPAALVEAYLGGQASGSALADVLLGDVEPGGRLAESFPIRTADLPAARNFPTSGGSRTQTQYREGLHVGYRFHDTFGVAPRFPFGHGLGYTTFAWGVPVVTVTGTDVIVEIDITNTGHRLGSEVVQLYVHDPESSVHRPDQTLEAFAKVHLAPGHTRSVRLALDERAFAIWDVASSRWLVEGGRYEVRIGASSRDIRASAHIEIESADRVTAVPGPIGPVADDHEFERALGRPIPAAAGILPFTVDSTIDDLRATWFGRRLHSMVSRMLERQLPAGDDSMSAMMRAVISGMPLRAMVVASGGKLTLDTLDRVIRVLNALSR
ncbi:glycoside hydrolase family 3 C-terminal domain-containing protein [Agromyces sp. GXS1127]|uniref:glycoside hydrolase family 3 C-terminal domain-containing protein n=1 Tax=Agromyces sp. GXS1127 TaxID=3424181 RepID=UPI003D322A65